MDPNIIEKAKTEFGEDGVRLVRTGKHEFLVHRPARGDWKRYRKESKDPARSGDALEVLVRSCVAHPSREEFDRLLDRFPALCEEIAEPVLELAGLTGKVQADPL